MAMSMPCCAFAPYCDHNQRQMHSQALPSLGLGLGSDNTSWTPRTSHPPQLQYDFSRPPQPSSLLSHSQSYAQNSSKLSQGSHPFSAPQQTTSWSAPSHNPLNNDFSSPNWPPLNRSRSTFQSSASSSFTHAPFDYLTELKLDSFDLKEGSPSRATDFSTISTSTQSSPAPTAAIVGYDPVHIQDDGDSFLSTHPLAPEQVTVIDKRLGHSASPHLDFLKPSKRSRSRKRGSEVIHCEICHKTFDRRSNFKSHWETHDKDRQRTVCRIDGCNKTFGRPAEMTRHVNSAHRQKLFPCPSCGKEFTRHDILLRHCKDACPVLVKGKSGTKSRKEKTT